jgi:rhomboid-like protein
MHPIWMTAWRPARCYIQSSKTTTDTHGLRQVFSLLARQQDRAIRSCDAFPPIARSTCKSGNQKRSQSTARPFSTAATFQFQKASLYQQQIPPRAPSELAFRRNDLRPYEVKVVFGSNAPPLELANTLLKILHSRRVNGTLDLDLPAKLASQVKAYPHAVQNALQWLRLEYPIDEDAAILQRIEREEAGAGDEALINRAESLGLYKPQSGTYGAKLGEEGDIFGESELQKIRRENELRDEQEQKELEDFIEEKQQATQEKAGALEAMKEHDLEGMLQLQVGKRPVDMND